MKDYKRLTKNDWRNAKFSVITHKDNRAVLHRLWELEDKIERGEIDYVADKDNEIERLTAERDDYKSRAEVAETELKRYKRALYNISGRYERMLGFSQNEVDLLDLAEVRTSVELEFAVREIEEERK